MNFIQPCMVISCGPEEEVEAGNPLYHQGEGIDAAGLGVGNLELASTFKCTLCSKAFPSNSKLQIHIGKPVILIVYARF